MTIDEWNGLGGFNRAFHLWKAGTLCEPVTVTKSAGGCWVLRANGGAVNVGRGDRSKMSALGSLLCMSPPDTARRDRTRSRPLRGRYQGMKRVGCKRSWAGAWPVGER